MPTSARGNESRALSLMSKRRVKTGTVPAAPAGMYELVNCRRASPLGIILTPICVEARREFSDYCFEGVGGASGRAAIGRRPDPRCVDTNGRDWTDRTRRMLGRGPDL